MSNKFMYCIVYKGHCYVYRAVMRMVELIFRERTTDCRCKKEHTKKFASVLEDVRRANYMLFWVVSVFDIYINLIIFPE